VFRVVLSLLVPGCTTFSLLRGHDDDE